MSEVFPALITGHLVGDWVLQTKYMADNKLTNWSVRLYHVAVYTICVVILSITQMGTQNLLGVTLWVASTHFIIDSRRYKEDAPLFVQIGCDQSLHVLTLYIITLWRF